MMILRSCIAGVALLATLAAAAQAQTHPRIFALVNRTTESATVKYTDYATGATLLHAAIPAGRSSIPEVPENTEIHVRIDRAGCSTWQVRTAKTGTHTFYILPGCKVEVTWSLPQ